ncbi:BON domain-containing protein [Paraburkholderia lacunae]|uniref:Osmotically-inducible protein Y n=1 Tax=Paraburkholderia lacunae TaxID=2211104 RepID=A0A370MXV4_9BURK|nr:BON domain-containing protein [Paraburkholderia lacunae]RDJ98165.1 transporter [Paraburkholderia lacunae]
METINFLKFAAGAACMALAVNLSAQETHSVPNDTDTPAASINPTHDSVGQGIDDTAITTKVKASLLAEKNFRSLHVKVRTREGVVRLSGTVPSLVQKHTATDVAQAITGVKSVENHLVVAR